MTLSSVKHNAYLCGVVYQGAGRHHMLAMASRGSFSSHGTRSECGDDCIGLASYLRCLNRHAAGVVVVVAVAADGILVVDVIVY